MSATYDWLIDWDGDGGHNLGTFDPGTDTYLNQYGQQGVDGWYPGGTVPPTIAISSTRSYAGDTSLLVEWTENNPFQFDVSGSGFDDGKFGRGDGTDTTTPGGTLPQIQRDWTGLVVGRSYTLSAWVYIPTGSPHVIWAVGGVGFGGTASTVRDEWVRITFTFTATATTHSLQVWPTTAPAGAEPWWFDAPQILMSGEDVGTARRVLDRGIEIRYGRDTKRASSQVSPAETAFALNNRSQDYSPDNASSPLYGYLAPSKAVTVRAHLSGHRYTLLNGTLDDYEIVPDPENREVRLSVVDDLGRLNEQKLSTELVPSGLTGELMHAVLDAVGWPEDRRDIDSGATVVRWWWEEGTTAYEALQKLCRADGPPAFITINAAGWFVFRDRHHRLLRDASVTSQATFRDAGAEPRFSPPVSYDIGWKDVVNSVEVDVQQREAVPSSDAVPPVVWQDEVGIYTLAAGETREIQVKANDPFYNARTPSDDGSVFAEFEVLAGTVTVSLSRTSGQTATIVLHATTAAQVQGMALRAWPITVARTVQVTVEDAASIAAYGLRSHTDDIPWADVHDVQAIATLIAGQRAERLPTVTITLKPYPDTATHTTRLTQMLTRDLSDRVHIVEAETSTDRDFHVEQIEHTIREAGKYHETAFGCEATPSQVANVFTFDSATAGFNDGLFGRAGFDDPDVVFVLDVSQLDVAQLGH